MPRQTNINVNVNSTSAVKSIKTLKDAFVDLNETIKNTSGTKNKGKITLEVDVDLGKVDLATLGKVARDMNKLSKAMDKLKLSTSKYSEVGQIFSITNNHIENAVVDTSKQVDKLSSKFLESAVVIEMWRRGFSGFINVYKEMSASTFSVGVADQATISQIEGLSSAFMSLSSTVPHTASSLATAVDDLIRTGRSFEESKKIIEQVAVLSTASGDSLKDTAQVVTKVMTALDISANRTVETLNAMHSTAIRTASDMGYLAEAFKNVAGTTSVLVKASGLSGEQLDDYKQKVLDLSLSISGAMANMGLSASY